MLKEHCYVNTNEQGDRFVGLKVSGKSYQIYFPMGFSLSESDDDIRSDIILLVSSLARYTDKLESDDLVHSIRKNTEPGVLLSYLYIIQDFCARGYYKEHTVEYISSKTGKIHWGKTIKNKRPFINGADVFFIDFITQKTRVNQNDLLTLIHMYCVFRSFFAIGWLFGDYIPLEPNISFDKKLFKNIVFTKLRHTFDDKNKELFKSMLNVILNEPEYGLAVKDFTFGTSRFEYIWERMIDSTFGIENKKEYFPKTYWILKEDNRSFNSSLEPDTIMLLKNCVYVLDAKYYKYGHTMNVKDLPDSSSISKQITYGEYIAETPKFKKLHGSNIKVYNVFLMPFSAVKWKTDVEFYIGDACSDWKNGDKSYEKIKGILIDVKYLMKIAGRQILKEIEKLAFLIESSH